jgi:hypothetical protein
MKFSGGDASCRRRCAEGAPRRRAGRGAELLPVFGGVADPGGLALLVFQTCPMLYVLLSGRWARKCRGRRLRRDGARARAWRSRSTSRGQVRRAVEHFSARVMWAFGGAFSFAFVYYMNSHSLKAWMAAADFRDDRGDRGHRSGRGVVAESFAARTRRWAVWSCSPFSTASR